MLWRIHEFFRNIFTKKRVEQELDEEIRAVSALLAIVALLASYIPAHRAAQADPMNSLRYE